MSTGEAAKNAASPGVFFTETKPRNLWGDALRRLIANKLSLAGLVVTIIFFIIAIIGPYIAPYSYTEQAYAHINETPTPAHWLGTDELGRDFLSRLLYGARSAGLVAIIVTVISTVIGVVLGSVAAYSGGWVDGFIVRLVDVTMTIPGILLAALANTTLKKPLIPVIMGLGHIIGIQIAANSVYLDYFIVIGALGLISWPTKARLIRGQIFSLRNELYVDAARSIGASTFQVLRRHIIPNAMGPVIVAITFTMAGAITLESSLSFLGIGIQPPGASWGAMISSALGVWRFRPWLLAAPAIVLGIVTLAIMFLGDGLNDALDPRRT